MSTEEERDAHHSEEAAKERYYAKHPELLECSGCGEDVHEDKAEYLSGEPYCWECFDQLVETED